jgi:Ger(x)C family germination protein
MEERHFVLAAGIDLADEGLKSNQSPDVRRTETFVQPHGGKRYRLSLQILNLKPGGGGDDGDSEKDSDKRTYVISNTGQSLLEMTRDLLGQDNKNLWWEHLQTIIISEAVLKETGLKPIFDWFLRDREMRWRIRVFVTPGPARPLLEYQPPSGEPGGIFFAGIMQNHRKDIHLAGARTDLGWASQALDNDDDIVLPRIELKDKVLKVNGTAAFNKDKFVGYLDDYAIKGVRFINGIEKSADVTIDSPDYPGGICVFELFRHDTRLRPHIKDGQVYFTLDISMVGNINEMQEPGSSNKTSDPEYIRKLEVLFAEEVKKSALYAWRTMQAMHIDRFGLNGKLEAHETETWEKLKDKWDEIYPTVPLVVSVNVTIRGIGEHK